MLLSIAKAAKIIGVGDKALRTLAKRADFPSCRLGRKILIDMDAAPGWFAEYCRADEQQKQLPV